ncbi:hypothetical protein F442_14361 [Phytophthora nicotianae P10297]|uniref:Uncharacterized protein n=1 Tax=Phytophthora nicotianae P10297 TaxID=1317064 RepID=W2YT67_PHYNI|nr:hypothetical protein F442_14361 [Phytophthora nicotianae P10297]
MCGDFVMRPATDLTDHRVLLKAITQVNEHLISNGTTLAAYPSLPQLSEFTDVEDSQSYSGDHNRLIDNELGYNDSDLDPVLASMDSFNNGQQAAYDGKG